MLQGIFFKSLAAFSAAAAAGTGLGAPTTTLISGESQVLINWTAPTDPINGVDIEESTDSGNTWATVTKLPPTSTHIRVQGLTDGKNYYFRVRWIWPDNSLGIPSVTMVGVPINNPTTPTGLVATASGTQVALNWDLSTQTSITGYEIQQSTDGGTTWTNVTMNTGSASPGYLVDGLTPGNTYSYRVKALAFGGGQSDFSDAAVVKIGKAPTGGFALNYSIVGTKVTLTWDTPTDLSDVASYTINTSGDGGRNWYTVANTQGGVNTAIVPYVIGGSTYQVVATSAAGDTSASAVELIETNAIPDPVTTATFNPGATAVPDPNQTPIDLPTDSPTPTPTDTSSTTPTPAAKSSSLPIIPIAGGLVVVGVGAWLLIGMRNKGSKKRPKSRPKPKRKPAKKPTKNSGSDSSSARDSSKKGKK